MANFLEFKEAKCKNCYKCLKSCPVKAIKIEENQAKIIEDRCILCGNCTLVCPQNAKSVHSELDNVENLLKNNKVIATIAPSFISSFEIKSFESLRKALMKCGFYSAEETARGASIVVDEYEKILKTKKYKNFITSCCPAINRMISLYYPDALEYLAPVDSPVIAHAKVIKKENPDAKVVFVGPCIAKKRECYESGLVDGVLTFEELVELLTKNNITLENEDEILPDEIGWNKARFFPISRGVIKSFNELADGYEYIAVDGVENSQKALAEIGKMENVFLEINACQGSCVGGPCALNKDNSAIFSNTKIRKYVSNNDGVIKLERISDVEADINLSHVHENLTYEEKEPTEEEIKEVLNKMGKFTEDDELNCGACGYNTCRQKAWAVINGYADAEMCLPYMRDRAENMSYEIIRNSPNGIIVVDDQYRIIDINAKAKMLIGLNNFKPKEVSVLELLDESEDFVIALTENKNIMRKQIKISRTNSYVELSINHIKNHNMMFAIMKDITEKVNYDDEINKLKLETLAMADDVIKKQMRVAHEIASLLGETTAETKIALVNLKKTLKDDEKKGDE